jgi:hypothetical protein
VKVREDPWSSNVKELLYKKIVQEMFTITTEAAGPGPEPSAIKKLSA